MVASAGKGRESFSALLPNGSELVGPRPDVRMTCKRGELVIWGATRSCNMYTLLECVIKGLNLRLTDIITLQVCGGALEQGMGRTPKDEPGKEVEEEKMENVE